MKRLRLAVALAGAALLTACSSPAAENTDAAAMHTADLTSYLLSLPSGAAFAEHPHAVTAQEDADTAQFPSDRLKTLKEIGFKAEASESFTTSAGNEVRIDLMQSNSAGGAYMNLSNEEGYAANYQEWRVPDHPNAVIYLDPNNASGGQAGMEGLAESGDTLIILFDTMPSASPTEPTALLTSQLASLA